MGGLEGAAKRHAESLAGRSSGPRVILPDRCMVVAASGVVVGSESPSNSGTRARMRACRAVGVVGSGMVEVVRLARRGGAGAVSPGDFGGARLESISSLRCSLSGGVPLALCGVF